MGSTAYSETYTYNDSDGSLNTMTTGVGTTLTMGYDGLRRLTSVTGGPVTRQYTYRDIDSAKTTMQVASVTSGGQRYGYTYDSMGNIATFSAPGKGTITYTYDNQSQLLSATGDTTYTYTYDGAGNILTANGHTYTYGDTDWKDLLTGFDGQAIIYDAIGNPTSYYNGTRWNFTWANGRGLATASDGTNSLSFAYDASGLRTSKTVNGTTYRYYYAGGKLMRMTWGTNTIDFFYDANGTPYAMKYNGTVYYYITNLQGDVMRIVDASQNIVTSYDYDPYGKVISATGTLANVNPLRYRGYVYDQETGFYYLNSRYYDPAVGRFINSDEYASTGQGLLGNNMYAYCQNNPVKHIDSQGTFINTITGAVVGGIIGAINAAIEGDDVLAAAAIGAATGAIAGVAADIAIATGGVGAIAIAAVGGAISGGLNYAGNELANKREIRGANLVLEATVGAAANLLTFGTGGGSLAKRGGKVLTKMTNSLTSTVMKNTTKTVARKTVYKSAKTVTKYIIKNSVMATAETATISVGAWFNSKVWGMLLK